jgi:hypothetical protein
LDFSLQNEIQNLKSEIQNRNMFGLMRARKCGMTDAEKHFRRLNYCGTCKTIGALYGQKSRLLLNHDAVFLAEILSALSGEDVNGWQESYQSFNCLNLPKNEMPTALRFAATTNVILTEFKLADHQKDSRKKRFKAADRIFSKEFREAEKRLSEWNFPLEKIHRCLVTQQQREAENISLESVAFPTAETTATFFREGARLIGKNDLQNLNYEIGFAFGKLIYLLDAFEDYEKDLAENQFNAFRAAFELKENKISGETKRRIATILRELESETLEKIQKLPIAENQKTLFAARLSQNLQRKLKTNLPVIQAKKICSAKPKKSFAVRWQNAKGKARSLAGNYSWQMPLVFLFVFVFALVAPAQTREAKSARECFDLSFNLMFLGAFFGAVLAFPKTVLMKNIPSGNLAEKAEKKRRWCDYCDCDCDCCCCCEEGCDGCDCCSGCCDNCGCDGCCDCSCD